MAESAVTFLLNQLTPFFLEEARVTRGIREEVEYIRDELDSMRAFLRVADAMEENDPEIHVWVKQVRDVAYDTEDVLDEFIIRLERHHGDGFYGCLRKISFSVKTLKARRRIASELQRIRSRVSHIAERHQRYRYKFNISEQGSSSTVVNRAWYDNRGDALLLEEAELVGIDKPKKQLVDWLVEENLRLEVVSVTGMGGLGKTTLVKKAYEDLKVKKHFQSHAWINVSQSYNTEELLRELIQQLYGEFRKPVPQRMETMDSHKMKAVIKEFLQNSRYVIVLDDVWTTDAWDAFKHALPDSKCGSRVLLTTRIGVVASTPCAEAHGNIYNMKALSPEESWTLFCRKTFQGNPCPPHLEEIARGILHKCEGLPLAIVAISGVLATKANSGMHEWEMVRRCLGDELEGNDKLKSMKKILSLSYNDLPYYLKICFLYFSIFPEDYLIERNRLIRLWTAEGFAEVREGKTTEEVAEGYLIELVNRSMVQMGETNYDGSLRSCRIHDLLREIVISKSKEQNIVSIAGEGETCWPEKARRLSIQYITGNVQQNIRVSRLRSLLMFDVAEPLSKPFMPLLFGNGVRLLRILELKGASLETIPNELVKLLHLRYLSLRRTKVKVLPNTIAKLKNLETLDLKYTCVTELPVQILKLRRLHHLFAYNYQSEGYQPFHHINGIKGLTGIGDLSSLQKLCFIEMNHGNGGTIAGELGSLTQLRRLGIIKLRREDGMALCSSIQKMSSLRSLNIGSVEENEIIDIQSLASPPRFLQRLYLEGRLEKLPEWLPSLHNLVEAKLRWSKLSEDPLQLLQDLPNLVYLELRQAYEGEGLCFKGCGFQKLKILRLASLNKLRWVRLEEGSMPHLERLYIENCNLVEEVPSGIEHLSYLQLLILDDMSDKLIAKVNREKGEDYWKIVHITKVFVGSFQYGDWRGHPL